MVVEMMSCMRWTEKLGKALDYANNHHHLLPTAALRAAGFDRDQIAELAADGVIERIIRGLYRRPGTQSPIQDIAATLQRHRGAVASHTSALFVHDLEVTPPGRPHFTLPVASSGGTRLGVVHRSPLPQSDQTRRQRLPVTTVARSIVDSGELLSVDSLAAVVNEAVTRQLVTIPQIIEVVGRVEAAPGRIGVGRVRRVLATWTDAIKPGSVAEAAAIRKLRSFGIPEPVTQFVLVDNAGEFVARMDMAWPEHRVAREYDSVKWHRLDRIEPDELRYQRIEALGWTVDPLYRTHLVPGAVDWLTKLDSQLRASGRAAS